MPVGDGSLEIVLAKAADVVTYVETGVCDMGVVGKRYHHGKKVVLITKLPILDLENAGSHWHRKGCRCVQRSTVPERLQANI